MISGDSHTANVMTGTTALSINKVDRFLVYVQNWGYAVVSHYGLSVFWAPTLTRQQASMDLNEETILGSKIQLEKPVRKKQRSGI